MGGYNGEFSCSLLVGHKVGTNYENDKALIMRKSTSRQDPVTESCQIFRESCSIVDPVLMGKSLNDDDDDLNSDKRHM